MEENKNETTNQKPSATIEEIYADAKQTITLGVRNLIRAFPLPIFMIRSILESILSEYEKEAYLELASCVDEHKQKTEEYYEAKIKEMAEQFEKEREELIQSFEKQDLPGTTPEGEPESEPESVPEQESGSEEKVIVEKKYAGGERIVEEVE